MKVATPSDCLSEFLTTVEKLREKWKTDDEDLWFRGEREEYGVTRLRPKLYRGMAKMTPRALKELLQLEVSLFDDFQRCGGPLCESMPEDDWEWYFLMQHYGGPTRLLDWSDGALMALHFAIRDYPRAKGDPLVYVLDANWLAGILDDLPIYKEVKKRWRKYRGSSLEDKAEEEWTETYLPKDRKVRSRIPLPDLPLLWDPAHVTRRFAAQRSRFMVFGRDFRWLTELAKERDSKLHAIPIKEECVPEIKREVRGAGVTESVIFPDLDGLGRELSQLWEDRKGKKHT